MEEMMVLLVLGATFALIFAACSVRILTYAFGRSTGTGVMVLLMPGYILYFAFSQLEHRFKNHLLAAWIGSLGLTAFFFALATNAVRQQSLL
jgi:hypothetical protein